MNSRFMSITVAAALLVGLSAGSALAGGHRAACQDDCGCESGCRHGCGRWCHHGGGCKARWGYGSDWVGGYSHTMWGQPVALVVPPTAELQTHWNWGVAQTRVNPIWPQFARAYPGPYAGGRGFLPTPRWPSSTDQFGVYYVRGPW
jgi:hypothetical protein